MNIIFPSHPVNKKEIDPSFKGEFDAALLQGFNIILFDEEDFSFYNAPHLEAEELCIFRGWMMKPEMYDVLYRKLFLLNYRIINDATQYKKCHYFPEVYTNIKSHTPKAIWFKDLAQLNIKGVLSVFETSCIIKDYVKSVNEPELKEIPVNISNADFNKVIKNFIEKRGNLFSEGIVLKQKVTLKKYFNYTNEWRVVVLNERVISKKLNINNSDTKVTEPNIDFLNNVIPNINSNYYTIDIAELENGEWTIIETGDGGVSGLAVHENTLEYFSKLMNGMKEVAEAHH